MQATLGVSSLSGLGQFCLDLTSQSRKGSLLTKGFPVSSGWPAAKFPYSQPAKPWVCWRSSKARPDAGLTRRREWAGPYSLRPPSLPTAPLPPAWATPLGPIPCERSDPARPRARAFGARRPGARPAAAARWRMRLGGVRTVSGKKAAAAAREAGARWRPVRVYTAAGGCGRGTRRGGGGGGGGGDTMVMAHFVENFWVSGGCRERRGLRLLPAACVRGGRRLSRFPSEGRRGPGLPGRASRGGPRLSGQQFLRAGSCAGRRGWQRGPGAAARTPRARGAGRGDKAPTGRARCRARGAGRPAGVCFPRRRPGTPRRVGARPGGLGTSSRARDWARGAAPRTLPPGLLTKPVRVASLGPSSFSPHPSRLPRGVLACSRCVPVMAWTLDPPPPRYQKSNAFPQVAWPNFYGPTLANPAVSFW